SIFSFTLTIFSNSLKKRSSNKIAILFSSKIKYSSFNVPDIIGHFPIAPAFIHRTGKISAHCLPNATECLSRKPNLKYIALLRKQSDIILFVPVYLPVIDLLSVLHPVILVFILGQVTYSAIPFFSHLRSPGLYPCAINCLLSLLESSLFVTKIH